MQTMEEDLFQQEQELDIFMETKKPSIKYRTSNLENEFIELSRQNA